MTASSKVLRIARWSAFFAGVLASTACSSVDLSRSSSSARVAHAEHSERAAR